MLCKAAGAAEARSPTSQLAEKTGVRKARLAAGSGPCEGVLSKALLPVAEMRGTLQSQLLQMKSNGNTQR